MLNAQRLMLDERAPALHAEGGTSVHAALEIPHQERAPALHAEGGTGVHAALEIPHQERAHGIHAEGGTGVHAAQEIPPQEGAPALHAEGGTGVHAARKLPLKKIPIACVNDSEKGAKIDSVNEAMGDRSLFPSVGHTKKVRRHFCRRTFSRDVLSTSDR